MESELELALVWTQAPSHGFGPPPQREGYKLEYRHDPLTRDFQYRYAPAMPTPKFLNDAYVRSFAA